MARIKMTQIYRRHEQSFVTSLKLARSLQEKPVHRLRLNVKNLRSILLLQHAVSGRKKAAKQLRKLVQPIFRYAGELRGASLNLKLIGKQRNAALVNFRRLMKQRRATSSKALAKAIETFDGRKFSRLNNRVAKSFQGKKRKEIRRDTEDYLRMLFARVRAEIFDMGDDESLHEIRKKLKVIRNLGALMNEFDHKHPFTGLLAKLNATYEKIGAWHDQAILLQELECYLKELNDPRTAVKAAPVIEKIRNKCTRTRQHIEKKLKMDLVL